jgi:adenylosuccinate synthase
LSDLLNEGEFRAKLKTNLQEKNHYIMTFLHEEGFEIHQIYHDYLDFAEKLDIDHGTYPYVTSSNTVAGEAATGSGIGPSRLDTVMGVTKAYATRVGEGPFPTELEEKQEEAIREKGGEYGATTGRPRRCGWFDAVAVKYSVRINGLDALALTKLDVLDNLKEIKICTAYKHKGQVLRSFPTETSILEDCEPVCETLPGWGSSTRGARKFKDLPEKAQGYIKKLEEAVGVEVTIISVGAGRKDAIISKNPFTR